MRAGGCTVQQALTAEAAAVVKQAVSLARRRGNAQVTPLHVASAMLHQQPQASPAATSSPVGLLRAACLRSHSHPLQCKALELCFNVALNRLPASASPLLGGHGYYPPSLSNALVAAFKRAQAHQRRGGGETAAAQQQQAVVAVKIELEQLVISILDDPSVSRVMREAGFSSTQVKANVEHAQAHAIDCSTKPPSTQNPNPSSPSPPADYQEAKPIKLPPLDQVREEDVAAILDRLAKSHRVMVVAECAAAAEAAARAAVERIRRGDARQIGVAGQVVTLAVSAFRGSARDEAERRLAELRRAVVTGGAVVIFVEDLAWAAEFWAAAGRRRGGCYYYYCGVEHAVAEVRALAARHGGEGVWVVAHGTYQTNMRCRAGHPSLETMWGLHTVAVPAGSLALTLTCAHADRDDSAAMAAVSHQPTKAMCDRAGNGSTSSPHCLSLLDAAGSCSSQQMMSVVSPCCAGDCASAAATKAMARSSVVMPPSTTTTSIPPWLLHHCRDQHEAPHMRKWMSAHGGSPSRRTALNISTAATSPCSSSISSYEQQYYHHHQPYYHPWLVADDETTKQQHPWKTKDDSSASNGGGASVDQAERQTTSTSRFKEVSAENLKALCATLEKAVAPWQRDAVVPDIASTVLRCRSGMNSSSSASSRDTWMLFLGGDAESKERVARELARLVFGSTHSFVSIGGAGNRYDASSSDSGGEIRRRKRSRPETETTTSEDHLDALYDAVKDNPRRVIMMERVDRAGRRCHEGIRDAIESGVVRRSSRDGETAVLGDAIVVLTCESFDDDGDDQSRIKKKAKTADGATQGDHELNDDDDQQQRRKDASSSSPLSSCFDLNMSVEEDFAVDEERCSGEAGGGQLLLKAVDRVLFFRSMES